MIIYETVRKLLPNADQRVGDISHIGWLVKVFKHHPFPFLIPLPSPLIATPFYHPSFLFYLTKDWLIQASLKLPFQNSLFLEPWWNWSLLVWTSCWVSSPVLLSGMGYMKMTPSGVSGASWQIEHPSRYPSSRSPFHQTFRFLFGIR